MERRLAQMPPGLWTRHFHKPFRRLESLRFFANFAVKKLTAKAQRAQGKTIGLAPREWRDKEAEDFHSPFLCSLVFEFSFHFLQLVLGRVYTNLDTFCLNCYCPS
jgi:hypothetical protein